MPAITTTAGTGGYEADVSFFGNRFGEDLTVAIAQLMGGDVEPVRDALKKADEPEAVQ
jgi:hypothetical protein